MSAAVYIYLAGLLSQLDFFLSIVGGIWIAASLFFTIVYAAAHERYHGKTWVIVAPLCMLAATVLIPKERTMWLMAGAVLGEKVVQSTVGKQAVEIIELKLQEEIDKLKTPKKEQK